MMEQWQEDLIATQGILKARLTALADFNAGEVFDLMNATEQTLLKREEQTVAEYLGVVSARISYF